MAVPGDFVCFIASFKPCVFYIFGHHRSNTSQESRETIAQIMTNSVIVDAFDMMAGKQRLLEALKSQRHMPDNSTFFYQGDDMMLRVVNVGNWCVLFLIVLVGIIWLCEARAQDDSVESVRVGNVVTVTDQWLLSLTSGQQNFYKTLRAMSGRQWSDGLPFDRLYGLFESRQFDCIVGEAAIEPAETVASVNKVRFEMVMFARTGEALLRDDSVTVGYLATLPRMKLPLAQDVEWYGLRTIKQGVDLIGAGRIDVLIAHASLFDDDASIARLPFPPVHVIELALVCHDTPTNRDFITAFDARLRSV
ncbi:hypothetical protein, partial [Thalassospira lucentensis]